MAPTLSALNGDKQSAAVAEELQPEIGGVGRSDEAGKRQNGAVEARRVPDVVGRERPSGPDVRQATYIVSTFMPAPSR